MLGTVNYLSSNAPQALTHSFLKTGFAILTNHPIHPQLIADTYEDWKAFFASDSRFDYLFDPKTQVGYRPFDLSETAKGYGQKDLKEFYNYYEGKACPEMVLDNTRKLRTQLLEVSETLLGWIEQEMPAHIRARLSEPLTHMIRGSHEHLLRPIYYPPLTGAEAAGALRSAPHEDINFITLLPAATAPGLQVRDVQGVWHELHCDPGAIVVNIAEMLDIATDGYYPATTHQVVNPQGKAAYEPRYSLPFFVHARTEVLLTYDRTVKDFLDVRRIELGLMVP